MYTGRTIEELIELVQHIHAHSGVQPRLSQDLAAPDRNDLYRNDLYHNAPQHNEFHHNDQHLRERLSSGRTPQAAPTTQPAWLAVFL